MAPLLAIFMLSLALRLHSLDTDSLWLDELINVTTSRLDLVTIPEFLATSDSHPPLLFVTTKVAVRFWGSSEFALRLPAALLGSASVLLMFKAGELLWGRKEGLIAAFLLSISAYHIRYSQEARNYSLMIFLGLLSLIFLLKALQRGQKRMWFLFAVCASLNLYTHYFALLILASESLFAVWAIIEGWRSSKDQPVQASLQNSSAVHWDHEPPASTHPPSPSGEAAASSGLAGAWKQVPYLLAALALVGLFYLPWLPFLRQQFHGRYITFEGLGLGEPPGAHLSFRFFVDALQAYTGVEGALLLLFLALFALGLTRSRSRHVVLLGLGIVTPFLLPFVVRAGHHFSLKYAIFVVPLFLLGMARGISVLTDWLTRHLPVVRYRQQWRLALTSALAVSVFGALSVAPIRGYYLEQKADYRGVASYLEQRLLPGDVILVDGVKYRTGEDADWTKVCLSYYMDPRRLEETPLLPVQQGFWANLHSMAQSQGELVAVLARRSRPASWDHQTDVVVIDFEDLSVIHLRQPTGDLLPDAVSLLEALVRLLRKPDAQFEVHLALAEAYAQMGRALDAGSQIVLASTVMPDDQRAVADLAEARAQLQPSLDIQLGEMTLGDSLSLRGYNIRPASLSAGDTVIMNLWWQAEVRMETDYTAFIHILRPDGQMLLQEDRLLLSGNRPTSRWRVGEVVRDEYQLVLPPDAEPGQYVVLTGVYCWKTGERLPVWDSNGQRVTNDTITLGAITVASPPAGD